jgi:putative membrane protein
MFIDYVTFMIMNLVAGTSLLAYYIYWGMEAKDQRPFAAAFGIVGLVGLILGINLAFTWPLPGSYNVAYSELTALFGAVFLATGVALSQGWDLMPMAVYAFFAGFDAILVGIRIFSLGLTTEPIISSFGFIAAGLDGILAFPFLKWFRKSKTLRLITFIVLALTALLWLINFSLAMWAHLATFKTWLPATMK